MTDNEIIKALERLTYGGNNCFDCKYKITKGEKRCGIGGCNIANNAIDLINRQKAEIERLQEILGGTSKVLSDTCAGVRIKAIKEFAKRLKVKFMYDKGGQKAVDNTLKEMVGEY